MDAEDRDGGIDYLLQLHGVIQVQSEKGHWVKFEVSCVPRTALRPHGIKYSLTLHAPNGTRLMGYDNAHPVKSSEPGSHLYQAYDHCHRRAGDTAVPYAFSSAWRLLQDFYEQVDRILKEETR